MSKGLILSALVLATVCFAGCGSSNDGMGQFKKEDVKAFDDLEAKQRDIYKRAGGVWEKMTPEDKAYFLEQHLGMEGNARRTWAKYAGENQGKSPAQLQAEAGKAMAGQ
jgi:hypothetical protein